jgi:Calcium-dependent channel, 7TM region, putative phosphate
MVYKKQILYVYAPIYESGGTFFPDACDRTLFGLMCGQLTLIGYTTIRQSYYEVSTSVAQWYLHILSNVVFSCHIV